MGRLLVAGEPPAIADHVPGFALERAAPDARASLVLDLGEGEAGHDLWGGAFGRRILLGAAPETGSEPDPAARALLEVLAAGEALWRLLGHEPHAYDFEL